MSVSLAASPDFAKLICLFDHVIGWGHQSYLIRKCDQIIVNVDQENSVTPCSVINASSR